MEEVVVEDELPLLLDDSLPDVEAPDKRPPPLLLLVAAPLLGWESVEEMGDTPLPLSLPDSTLLLSFDWCLPRVPPPPLSSEATPPTPDSRSLVTEVLADGVMAACLPKEWEINSHSKTILPKAAEYIQ